MFHLKPTRYELYAVGSHLGKQHLAGLLSQGAPSFTICHAVSQQDLTISDAELAPKYNAHFWFLFFLHFYTTYLPLFMASEFSDCLELYQEWSQDCYVLLVHYNTRQKASWVWSAP